VGISKEGNYTLEASVNTGPLGGVLKAVQPFTFSKKKKKK
jgi:hypothetical protein